MPQAPIIRRHLRQPLIITLALLMLASLLNTSARASCSTPSFRTAPGYAVGGAQPRSIAVGDFNADGKPDIATANYTSSNISVLLNLGGGVYGAPANYLVGDSPMFVVTSDFNNDGKLDLAVANRYTNNVSILLGNGNGTFVAAVNYGVGSEPSAIAVGDFNGDTKLDLAVANSASTFLSILLGTGTGTFAAGANVPVVGGEGGLQFSVAAGDINNDNKLDLVVTEYASSTKELAILPGVGNGTFGAKISLQQIGQSGPYSVALADLNGDNRLDIITANLYNNNVTNGSVTVILGNGTINTTNVKTNYTLSGGDPIRLTVGDFNGDSKPDVATANYGTNYNTVSVLTNTGVSGGLGNEKFHVVSGRNPIVVAAADLDGDTKLDLATANYNTNNVSVLLNAGANSFRAAYAFPVLPPVQQAQVAPRSITTADFNSDGNPDVLTLNNTAYVNMGDGTGGFGPTINGAAIGASYDNVRIPSAIADFNLDGKPDLALLEFGNFQVQVLLGSGNGVFTNKQVFTVGTTPEDLVAGDFNGDGKPDLAVVAATSPNTITILIGQGNGNFTFLTNYNLGASYFIIARDFNNDGKLDLAAQTPASNGRVVILLGNGNGTFTQQPAFISLSTSDTKALVSADFDADGKPDIAVLNGSPSNDVSIFRGLGDGNFGPGANFPIGATPVSLAVGDFNRDGFSDLVAANQSTGTASVITSNNAANFSAPTEVIVLGNPNSVAVADFNRDGGVDFVTAHNNSPNGNTGAVTVVLNACPGGAQVADFDGDGQTDISVWNPTNGNWYIFNSRDNSFRTQADWGRQSLGDILVPGDYDGDNKTDVAIFRQSEGNWYIVQSATNTIRLQNWGGPNDRPARADFDGDGKTDFAVFRPTEGNWYILLSATNTTRVQGWGISSDKLVPGDYDGDAKADIAVWRPSEGNWYIIRSTNNSVIQQQWGIDGDVPVPGDYDGDKKTDIAVWRPSEGNWYIIKSSTNTIMLSNWGDSTDIPIPGDYDKDGKTDVAVYRPSQGNWYIIPSSTGVPYFRTLGVGNEVPIPSTYIPYQAPMARPSQALTVKGNQTTATKTGRQK